jgi:hypothetical protein
MIASTLGLYNNICFSTTKMLSERASVLRLCLRCLSCFVRYRTELKLSTDIRDITRTLVTHMTHQAALGLYIFCISVYFAALCIMTPSLRWMWISCNLGFLRPLCPCLYKLILSCWKQIFVFRFKNFATLTCLSVACNWWVWKLNKGKQREGKCQSKRSMLL